MTTHGCRSMLRTWASEVASFPTDIVEMALAHSQSKFTAAYQRGDLLAKRARLMQQWAEFLENDAADRHATVLAFTCIMASRHPECNPGAALSLPDVRASFHDQAILPCLVHACRTF